jgi:hypothetical protein
MSQDIGIARTHDSWVRATAFWGGAGWPAGGLVVAGGVDGELAEEFAGGGVDDADVQVLDEQQDVGSGVGPADADVVQAPVDPQRDAAGLVDLVGADAVVGVGGAVSPGSTWSSLGRSSGMTRDISPVCRETPARYALSQDTATRPVRGSL